MSDEGQRPPAAGVARLEVWAVAAGEGRERPDLVAVEEPLEVRVVVEESGRRHRHSVAVTMRTPGHDFELAAGFLYGEGLLADGGSIAAVGYCAEAAAAEARNIVEVVLAPGTPFDPARFSRNVYTSSSCGICGRGALELVRGSLPRPPATLSGGPRVTASRLGELPRRLAEGQAGFAATGGLHAAALFGSAGEAELVREDVGRHNAVDKLVGALLLEGRLPAADKLLLVSGRASFELVQKAVLAGLSVLAAVGAPSSLAVELAREHGMTLVGFLRSDRFNVYCGDHRVVAEA